MITKAQQPQLCYKAGIEVRSIAMVKQAFNIRAWLRCYTTVKHIGTLRGCSCSFVSTPALCDLFLSCRLQTEHDSSSNPNPGVCCTCRTFSCFPRCSCSPGSQQVNATLCSKPARKCLRSPSYLSSVPLAPQHGLGSRGQP